MHSERLSWFGRVARAIKDTFSGWRQREQTMAELARLPPGELERTARECGLSECDLRHVAAQRPGGPDLLYRRLDALGIERQEIAAIPALRRDLERCCAMCDSKGDCRRDLDADPHGADWAQYCPNEPTLSALTALKSA